MNPGRISIRKAIPGSPRTTSTLGLTVDPLPFAPGSDEGQIALLRRARAEGVTVFDAAGGRCPARAEQLLARAFPEPDPELVILIRPTVGGVPLESPWQSPGRAPELRGDRSLPVERLGIALAESRRRLAPQVPAIVELGTERDAADSATEDLRAPLDALRSSGEIIGYCSRLPRDRDTVREFLSRPRPPLVSVELSLLDRALTEALDRAARAKPLGAFVRDPFAGGLLDGSMISKGAAGRPPRSGPVELERLSAQFAPVLRLGFLTSTGKRTLPQAALSYLALHPWVVSVLIRPPAPESWENVFGFERSAALSPDELARLAAFSSGVHPGDSPGPAGEK